ncbi:outer membrane autotransporter barrel domain protein [Collimonas fungivorans]|uniref:Outer membrane autotransporter barrel domain protein n=1 Tax=Collimonas fungivorans TaxID=158899 RepID=A0A127PDL4_9BURK|nr:autotransporter outer membrane beta-barrel domain-containing protein [Collimonas fungivorans]AMO95813.1 outer membrane autotransporter barrel domain protein [Collimonas fungivorans]
MQRALKKGMNGVIITFAGALITQAHATCSNNAPASGVSVTCSGTNVTPVAAQAGSTGVAVTLDSSVAASIPRSTSPVPFQVDTSSSIINNGSVTLTGGGGTGGNRGAALLGLNNNNQLTNSAQASISTTGAFNDGMAANGSGNTLINQGSISTVGPNAFGISAAWGQTNLGQLNNTIVNSGTITTAGSNARAISILGGSGTVSNSGSLSSTGANSPTVYMQGNNDKLTNSGTINASGTGSDAVFSNTVGSSFVASIENQAGGQIISQQGAAVRTLNGSSTVINAGLLQSGSGTAVSMGTGVNTLILQTGSVINGAANGGGNAGSKVVLQGSGTASNAFSNFATLQAQGDNWTWSGNGVFTTAQIQSGLFNLTGSLGGATTVASGATLAGNGGTIAGDLLNQGTLHPGVGDGSGGLTVTGNFTHAANGIFQTEASPVSAGLLTVGGTASLLGGTVNATMLPGSYPDQIRLPIVTAAGGVSGTFGQLQANATALLTPTLAYDNGHAYLVITRAPIATVVTSGNNAAIGQAIDTSRPQATPEEPVPPAVTPAGVPVATGALAETVNTLNLLDKVELQATVGSLTGGVHATFSQLALRENDLFGRALSMRLDTQRDGSRKAGDNGVWVRPYGSFGKLSATADTSGASYRIGGISAGADRAVGNDWIVGAGLDYAHLSADFDDYNGNGKLDSYKIGAYASYAPGPLYVDAIASYAIQRTDMQRDVLTGTGSTLRAKSGYDGQQASAYGELGYRAKLNERFVLQPFTALHYTRLRQDGFTETDAENLGLSTQSNTLNSLRSSLGVKISQDLPLSTGSITFGAQLRWMHEFMDAQAQYQATLIGAPGSDFTVKGVDLGRDAVLAGVNLSYAASASLNLFADYDYQAESHNRVNRVTLGLRYLW